MGNNFTISVNLQKLKNVGLVTINGKTRKGLPIIGSVRAMGQAAPQVQTEDEDLPF